MSDITIGYKGNTIGTMDASGSKKLLTAGKYCEGDIDIAYAKPNTLVKLGEAELTVNTTSTSVTNVGTINIVPASDVFTSSRYILITVRDKAGKQPGYFLGTDSLYANMNAANGSTAYTSTAGRLVYSYTSGNVFACISAAYGVYSGAIASNGDITITARYHSTYSLTINGSYKVEVWALPYAPNTNPFA